MPKLNKTQRSICLVFAILIIFFQAYRIIDEGIEGTSWLLAFLAAAVLLLLALAETLSPSNASAPMTALKEWNWNKGFFRIWLIISTLFLADAFIKSGLIDSLLYHTTLITEHGFSAAFKEKEKAKQISGLCTQAWHDAIDSVNYMEHLAAIERKHGGLFSPGDLKSVPTPSLFTEEEWNGMSSMGSGPAVDTPKQSELKTLDQEIKRAYLEKVRNMTTAIGVKMSDPITECYNYVDGYKQVPYVDYQRCAGSLLLILVPLIAWHLGRWIVKGFRRSQ